jgi:hypothetical protein
MVLTEFSQMVDTLVKTLDVVKKAKGIPSVERKKYRAMLDDTYTMLDSALLLVLNRLGNIIMEDDQSEFVSELQGLYNFAEWDRIEREVRLCKNLRYVDNEMVKIWEKLKLQISVRDQKVLETFMTQILEQDEAALAYIINESLKDLASLSIEAEKSKKGFKKAINAVIKKKESMKKVRQKLITLEIETLKNM